ncbi:hypothetical protein JKP88DRAFT_354345 [Tribonema minus]|uniref:Uncharacterized protein n=1 Tax=Tribonema minus TaxID=303371 RepID=A0A836CFQ5_9STRA|nr:hypothetical protein JKP88DRAFT_354345 [Tribonema minus]
MDMDAQAPPAVAALAALSSPILVCDPEELPHLQRLVSDEADAKVYEKNIHQTMTKFLDLRQSRKEEMYKVFKLISEKDHARERRQKVFEHFRDNISRVNSFQTGTVYEVTHEVLVFIDEFRELLDKLFSWCDLCLPANEQSFAESHRLKIQKFQMQIVNEMKRTNSARTQVNLHLTQRVETLRQLFTTKEVAAVNLEGWEKAHSELLTLQESNAYLVMGRSWEQLLESYLLLYNYWVLNLKHDSIVFGDAGRSSGNDYFA